MKRIIAVVLLVCSLALGGCGNDAAAGGEIVQSAAEAAASSERPPDSLEGMAETVPEVQTPAETPAPLKIISQPLSLTAAAGSNVQWLVEAQGDGLTYQWQYSTDGGITWADAPAQGSQTAALIVPVIQGRNGYMYRCRITDGTGQEVISAAARLTVADSTPSAETAAPAVISGKDWEATYSFDLDGDGQAENVKVCYEIASQENGRYRSLIYRLVSEDGTICCERTGMDCMDGSEGDGPIRLRIAETGGYLYVEGSCSGRYIYSVYGYAGDRLSLLADMENPGYTSGNGLYHCTDGEYDYTRPVYENEELTGADAGMKDALNGALQQYGLCFADDAFFGAELQPEQLVCDIVEDRETPEENDIPEDSPYVVAIEDAYVRTGAGRDYEALGILAAGTYAVYLNEQQEDERPVTWYKILYEGKEGWISSAAVRLAGEEAAVSPEDYRVLVTVDAYVRRGAGRDYEALGTLAAGEYAVYLNAQQEDERPVTWYKILYEGEEGWISSVNAELLP